MCEEGINQGGGWGGAEGLLFIKKLKDCLTEMVAFEQSHAGGEGELGGVL